MPWQDAYVYVRFSLIRIGAVEMELIRISTQRNSSVTFQFLDLVKLVHFAMKNTSVLLIKLPSLAESPSSNIAKVDPQRFASAFESLIRRKTRLVEIGSSVDVDSVGPLSSNLSPKYKNGQRAFFQSQRQLFNRFLTLQRRLIDIKSSNFEPFRQN